MTAPRCDLGRTALAEAEAAAFGGTDLETQLPIDALEARAAAVVASRWWAAAGGPPVDVASARAGAHSSSARSGRRVGVHLAVGQRDLATLGHELAHALAGVERGHDERFRAALVDVMAVLAGSPAALALRQALTQLGLAVESRVWPVPARMEGETFVVL